MPPPTKEELKQNVLNKNPKAQVEPEPETERDLIPGITNPLKKISIFLTKTVKVPIKKILSPLDRLNQKATSFILKDFEDWLLETDRRSRSMTKEEYYKYWISPLDFDPKKDYNVPVVPGALEEIEKLQQKERERNKQYNLHEVHYGRTPGTEKILHNILVRNQLGIATPKDLREFHEMLARLKAMAHQMKMQQQIDANTENANFDTPPPPPPPPSSSSSSSSEPSSNSSTSTSPPPPFNMNSRGGRTSFGSNSSHSTNLFKEASPTDPPQKRTVFTYKQLPEILQQFMKKIDQFPNMQKRLSYVNF
jgi:hypothetical protein